MAESIFGKFRKMEKKEEAPACHSSIPLGGTACGTACLCVVYS